MEPTPLPSVPKGSDAEIGGQLMEQAASLDCHYDYGADEAKRERCHALYTAAVRHPTGDEDERRWQEAALNPNLQKMCKLICPLDVELRDTKDVHYLYVRLSYSRSRACC